MKFFTSLLSLSLLMTAGLTFAADRVVVLDFKNYTYAADNKVSEIKDQGVTLKCYQGEHPGSSPKYYPSYNGIAFYGRNKFVLKSDDQDIKKVEFTTYDRLPMDISEVQAYPGGVQVLDYTNAVWTNNHAVDSLTVTPQAVSFIDGVCIQSMKIYLVDRENHGTYSDTPDITPAARIIDKDTKITITAKNSQADIYYTIDGSEPDPSSKTTMRYQTPFSLQKSALVKAVALEKGKEISSVSSIGYVVPEVYSKMSDLQANAKEGIYYTLQGNFVCTIRVGAECWIKDDTGAIRLYGNAIVNKRPESGSVLKRITGRYNLDNNNPELELIIENTFSPIPGEAVAPREIKATAITKANVNEYIVIKDSKIEKTGAYDFRLTDDSGTINVRNNYRLQIPDTLIGKTLNVELIPALYGSVLRNYIVKVVDPNAKPSDPDPEKPDDRPGNGSYSRPYSITEALALKGSQFEAGKWIKGYIIGTFPNQILNQYGTPTFGTANASSETLIMADDANCRDFTKCYKLIMIQGAVKNELNLKDNPDMLGKYVAIGGSLGPDFQCLQGGISYRFMTPPDPGHSVGEIFGDSDVPVVYYNLQGIPVSEENLEKGNIYICRQGKKVKKILF